MIGRSIGNYKIVRVLGEGGMGTVYLAEHPMIGKRVAVKMLRPDLVTDPGLVSRFFQEARAVNEIRHPNIVDISDFGHTRDGIVYFVMELMEGQSLRQHITSQKCMPLDQVVSVARQICDALAAAHRAGIIHRDLKPDNIFLVKDPAAPGTVRAKLFDFGVAKLLGKQEKQVGHKTMAGSVVGTPFYMSPEQALCQDVTAASDIYSMGVVMYEMTTGRVPFHAEQLVILLNAILKQAALPASRARPDVPPWLDRLLLRCLEKDANARPRSMEEVIAALNAGAAERKTPQTSLSATLAVAAPRPAMDAAGRDAQPRPAEEAGRPGPAHIEARRPGVQEDPRPIADAKPSRRAAQHSARAPMVHARQWLNTQRVRRVAMPLVVLSVVVVALSVFLSSKADEPIRLPDEPQPIPQPVPAKAKVNLSSEPPGAEVTRINDGRVLGTTPLIDVRPADGQQLNYRFHLSGYTDVQVPVEATAGANYEITATLVPVERRAERPSAPPHRGRAKAQARQATPAPLRRTTASASARQPVADPAATSIPPLLPSVRVRRIGH